jgi:hypothetical protein
VPYIPKTDPFKLAQELSRKPYRSAFPRALPNRLVRSIARDLRQVERLGSVLAPDRALLEGPLVVAAHILKGRLQERGLEVPEAMSMEGLARCLPIYQFVIERELVTRAVGVRIYGDEEALVAAFDGEIDCLVLRRTAASR